MSLSVLIIMLSASTATSGQPGQYAPAPQTYSVTSDAGGEVLHIYRSGQKVLLDVEVPPTSSRPHLHTRTLVNAASGDQVTWDLLDPKVPCTKGHGGWADPFTMYDQVMDGISAKPKPVGKAQMNGLATTVFDIDSPEVKAKMWRDDKYGLVVKFQVGPPNGAGMDDMVDYKDFTTAAPDPALFRAPSGCGQ